MLRCYRFFVSVMLLSATSLFVACQSQEQEDAPEGSVATVTFQVVNYVQVSLDELTRTAEATSLAHLDMAIYDLDNQLVVKQQTTTDTDGYGSFSASLPYGQYQVVFLGYDGSRTANLDSPTSIFFEQDYVPNLFHKVVQLTVDGSATDVQSVVLSRAVAAFRLQHAGDIPADLNTMSFVTTGGAHHLNGLTGMASQTEQRTCDWGMSSVAGKTSFGIIYYSFLPSEEFTMSVTATATDKQGNVIRTRSFSDVPMKQNYLNSYSGNFFAPDSQTTSFSLTLETDQWEEVSHTY